MSPRGQYDRTRAHRPGAAAQRAVAEETAQSTRGAESTSKVVDFAPVLTKPDEELKILIQKLAYKLVDFRLGYNQMDGGTRQALKQVKDEIDGLMKVQEQQPPRPFEHFQS